VGWRQDITPFLESLGLIVLDPTNKPPGVTPEDANFRAKVEALRKERRYKEIRELGAPIRNWDLWAVDNSNFLIVHYDLHMHLCGTMEELFWANRCKKPVLFCFDKGLETIPPWIIYAFPDEYFFESMDDLKNYLLEVNAGRDDSKATRRNWYMLDNTSMVKRALRMCA
jgi:hypothetical protein